MVDKSFTHMSKLSSDEKWKRFNKKLEDFMKTGDFFGLGTIYYEMADFIEEEGKDGSHLKELGYQMKLRSHAATLSRYKESVVVKEVDILCAGDPCSFCKQLQGKVFAIEQATLSKPIPVKDCIHEYGCRCVYLPRVV